MTEDELDRIKKSFVRSSDECPMEVACPLCKKAIGRGTRGEVRDLAEIVAAGLK